jgi:hypothetical protein
VSGALIQERETFKENKKLSHQVSIYFVSDAHTGSKKYYSEMEKICYAIVMSVWKLRQYFEAHRVRVLTNQPLNNIFINRDSSGKIGKWTMELSEHVVDFKKRSAIKSKVMLDFIIDWTKPSSYTEVPMTDTPWQVYCDWAWGSAGAGVVAVLISPLGIKLRYAVRLQFTRETNRCTNNIVEYEAMSCILKIDSKVIAR